MRTLASVLAQGLGFILACGAVGWAIGSYLADLADRWDDEAEEADDVQE